MYSSATAPAHIRIHLPALMRALGSYPELLESLEAGETKALGRVGANVSVMWSLAMRSMYTSADVPILATREVIQNSVDAIRTAIKQRILKNGQGRIEVEWDADARELSWRDDGIGMSVSTILERFLVLGESGKRNSGDAEMAGGFGIAKAVILGASSSFKWRMHTLDNDVICDGWEKDIEIRQASHFFQGTRITVSDVSSEYARWWDPVTGETRPFAERMKELLGANDLPGIGLFFNGQEVYPLFSRRKGSPITVRGSWGQGTTATVRAYKRTDPSGGFWIRLNGIFQYKQAPRNPLAIDVVIDLHTNVRPGEIGYPLNASRDSLQGQARITFRALADEVEQENLSSGKDTDDDVFDAEGGIEGELSAELAGLAAIDPELEGLFPAKDSVLSAVPGALPGEESGEERRPVVRTNVPDDYVLDLSNSGSRLPWFPKGLQTPDTIRTVLKRAEIGTSYRMSDAVIGALESATDGALTIAELKAIANEMDNAARIVKEEKERRRSANAGKPRVDTRFGLRKKPFQNPFGHLGGLRISKIKYPPEKARVFLRSARKWLPHLVLWSVTLKLMMESARIEQNIKPGFVLEDGTIGLTQKRDDFSPIVIYIHPDRLAENIAANRHQPIAIAGFLHGVGAHELAHADGRVGSGHSESYISAREALGARTAHLLPRLAELAVKLLKLPEAPDKLTTKINRLERQLQQAREGRDAATTEKRTLQRQLTRELDKCKRQLETLGKNASNQAQSTCTGTCQCQTESNVPEVVTVDPSNYAAEATAPPLAEQVVTSMWRIIRETPPTGIPREYIDSFFGRFRPHLVQVVEARLPLQSVGEG